MKCFEGLAFVFLPNLSSSRSRFLADLAQNQGGTIVDDISKLTGSVVVLINDSFVDEHHHLINEDIFLKEFEMNSDTLWNYICLLYTSDAADDLTSVDLGGRRIIKKTSRLARCVLA